MMNMSVRYERRKPENTVRERRVGKSDKICLIVNFRGDKCYMKQESSAPDLVVKLIDGMY